MAEAEASVPTRDTELKARDGPEGSKYRSADEEARDETKVTVEGRKRQSSGPLLVSSTLYVDGPQQILPPMEKLEQLSAHATWRSLFRYKSAEMSLSHMRLFYADQLFWLAVTDFCMFVAFVLFAVVYRPHSAWGKVGSILGASLKAVSFLVAVVIRLRKQKLGARFAVFIERWCFATVFFCVICCEMTMAGMIDKCAETHSLETCSGVLNPFTSAVQLGIILFLPLRFHVMIAEQVLIAAVVLIVHMSCFMLDGCPPPFLRLRVAFAHVVIGLGCVVLSGAQCAFAADAMESYALVASSQQLLRKHKNIANGLIPKFIPAVHVSRLLSRGTPLIKFEGKCVILTCSFAQFLNTYANSKTPLETWSAASQLCSTFEKTVALHVTYCGARYHFVGDDVIMFATTASRLASDLDPDLALAHRRTACMCACGAHLSEMLQSVVFENQSQQNSSSIPHSQIGIHFGDVHWGNFGTMSAQAEPCGADVAVCWAVMRCAFGGKPCVSLPVSQFLLHTACGVQTRQTSLSVATITSPIPVDVYEITSAGQPPCGEACSVCQPKADGSLGESNTIVSEAMLNSSSPLVHLTKFEDEVIPPLTLDGSSTTEGATPRAGVVNNSLCSNSSVDPVAEGSQAVVAVPSCCLPLKYTFKNNQMHLEYHRFAAGFLREARVFVHGALVLFVALFPVSSLIEKTVGSDAGAFNVSLLAVLLLLCAVIFTLTAVKRLWTPIHFGIFVITAVGLVGSARARGVQTQSIYPFRLAASVVCAMSMRGYSYFPIVLADFFFIGVPSVVATFFYRTDLCFGERYTCVPMLLDAAYCVLVTLPMALWLSHMDLNLRHHYINHSTVSLLNNRVAQLQKQLSAALGYLAVPHTTTGLLTGSIEKYASQECASSGIIALDATNVRVSTISKTELLIQCLHQVRGVIDTVATAMHFERLPFYSGGDMILIVDLCGADPKRMLEFWVTLVQSLQANVVLQDLTGCWQRGVQTQSENSTQLLIQQGHRKPYVPIVATVIEKPEEEVGTASVARRRNDLVSTSFDNGILRCAMDMGPVVKGFVGGASSASFAVEGAVVHRVVQAVGETFLCAPTSLSEELTEFSSSSMKHDLFVPEHFLETLLPHDALEGIEQRPPPTPANSNTNESCTLTLGQNSTTHNSISTLSIEIPPASMSATPYTRTKIQVKRRQVVSDNLSMLKRKRGGEGVKDTPPKEITLVVDGPYHAQQQAHSRGLSSRAASPRHRTPGALSKDIESPSARTPLTGSYYALLFS